LSNIPALPHLRHQLPHSSVCHLHRMPPFSRGSSGHLYQTTTPRWMHKCNFRNQLLLIRTSGRCFHDFPQVGANVQRDRRTPSISNEVLLNGGAGPSSHCLARHRQTVHFPPCRRPSSHSVSRGRNLCMDVIARSGATWQSLFTL
jgi:hypothetical protein